MRFPAARVAVSVVACLLLAGVASARAQTGAPTVIPVAGQLLGANGQPRTGEVVLVISLYEGQSDPAPRWIEHQRATLDELGRYSVQFGSTQTQGLPVDLFTGPGATRWIGVAAENEAEQPRVMLISVPYAANAASAEMLAGKPASDFVLASSLREDVRAVLEDEGVASDTVGTEAVTMNYLQKGDGLGGTTDSTVYESNGWVGIGTASPLSRLHILDSSESEFRMQISGGPLAVLRGTLGSADFGSFSAHPLRFFTNSAERIRIAPNGNIGIGTITPASQLHIVSNVESEFRLQINGGALAVLRGVGGAADIGSFSNHPLRIFTNSVERFRIDANGNVGVGTEAPTAKLHVAGTGSFSGDVTVNGNIAAKYQDVAEWVDAAEPLEAGTLVVIDTTRTNRVAAARSAYDGRVAGAVSVQPGLILGEPREGGVLVAQSGRVKVKADASFGAIQPGDLLVSSPTKGHVMRSKPVKVGGVLVHRPGTVVGKALEALPDGRGEILVLLTLQ